MALSLSYNKQNLEKVIIVAIALFASGLIGHNLREIGLNISPFCFSGAIALVSVYVWGKVPIPGIIGGNLLLIPLLGQDWLLTFGSAIGISLAAIAGASLFRWCQFSGAIENLWHIAILMAVALLSSTINATFGICFEYLSRNITLVELGTNWWIFWLGDAIAILLFTPTLLRVRRKKIHLFSEHPPLKWLEAGICLTLLAIISWIVFASPSLTTIVWYPLEYLPFPFVVWSALRFRFFGAIFSSVLVGVIALEGVSRGVGPFVFKSPDPESAILLLQIFIAVITVTALVLATVVNERQEAEARLIESLKRDRVLAEVAQKIRKSLDIQAILSTAVRETRNLLGADRVFYVSYCKFSESAQVLAESVNYNYPKIKGWIPNQQIIDETRYLMGSQDLLAIDNVQAYKTTPALAQYYQRYQIKASLIIALRHKDEILGLLVAHQCSRYRHWRQSELELWSRIATQVTIALQQAQLYRKIQKLNSNLESQVEERTQQLAEKITEVEKLNELKQIFLQGISHDLRTSIMGLLMVFKNLQQRRQNQITLSESILQKIIDSGNRQLTLVNALAEIDLAHKQSLALDYQEFDLAALIQNVISEFNKPLKQNQIQLTQQIDSDINSIWADYLKIKQVFANLINNSIQHNPPGITIEITAEKQAQQIFCQVKDNGVGIKAEQSSRLFKLYLRGTKNQRLTGIGLGCYQCRQIIESHGGQIGVDTNWQEGSRFWFTLPIKQ